jgi:hypothetical protein
LKNKYYKYIIDNIYNMDNMDSSKNSDIIQNNIEEKIDDTIDDTINEDNILFDLAPYDGINRCLECGIDLGECNPRQLCGKTYCENIIY